MKIKELTQKISIESAFAVASIYNIPTASRILLQAKDECRNSTLSPLSQFVTQTFVEGPIIMSAYAAQAIAYNMAVKEGHLETLLIPVIANVISGIYEIIRPVRNRGRK